MARAPSWVALRGESAPRKRPMGVRTALVMTGSWSAMMIGSFALRWRGARVAARRLAVWRLVRSAYEVACPPEKCRSGHYMAVGEGGSNARGQAPRTRTTTEDTKGHEGTRRDTKGHGGWRRGRRRMVAG